MNDILVKKFRKGDLVEVTLGKNKGKRGIIQKVLPTKGKVVVQGINIIKKRTKPTRHSPQAQVLDIECPIDSSNVAHIDPKIGVPTRIGYKFIDNKKVRYSKKSGELIDVI